MKLTALFQLKNFKNMSKQKKLILMGSVTIFILLFTSICLSHVLLSSPMVYSGVYLDNVSLEGLDKIELSKYLENKYNIDLSTLELSIYHRDYPVTVGFDELSIQIDKELVLEKVFSIGRKGNFFKRLIDIYKNKRTHTYLETEVFVDMGALDGIINQIYENTYIDAVSPSLLLMKDEVVIVSGKSGSAVNKKSLKECILKQLSKIESGIVIVPVDEILPVKIDTDAVYSKIVREPQDAAVSIINDTIEITPEVLGRKLDKAEFISLVAEMEAKAVKYPIELKLPVEFVQPGITAEKIEDSLFRDVLSVYTTSFTDDTENDRNRSVNIQLAVEAINGTILSPGESFSFNDIVGQRTQQKGYLPANVYTPDGIATGIGGGICQVSSTLYNAALRANLEVIERNPHIYMVAYVPLGCDASVSYGIQDLKFTNSTKWPVRIDGHVTSDNKIEFSIIGTNENPSLGVVIQSMVVELIPYTTEYIGDAAVSKGSKKILQRGMNGAIVDAYIIVKKDNVIVSNRKLHSTTYNILPEIIHVPVE